MTRLILLLLTGYKRLVSPFLGQHCRFRPTCSNYARVAVARFGPWRGGVLTAWRLARCQPFCEGGWDPVPEHFTLRRQHPPTPPGEQAEHAQDAVEGCPAGTTGAGADDKR